MNASSELSSIGVLGAGAMGTGIAQIAATHGHPVILYEINEDARDRSLKSLQKVFARLVEKGRVGETESRNILDRIHYTDDLNACATCQCIIEAVVEKLEIKQHLFSQLDAMVAPDCLLASNTSSLSIASISSVCKRPERLLGIHFFNPAPLMPLVEIIPGISTDQGFVRRARALIEGWGKTVVIAKDTPGFIVNRVARPFYGEALRLLEEGVADAATIDWAMRSQGGFRMGPFQLMDFIGNDINFAVTETVFKEMFYDPRYRPAHTQKRLVEAGRLGRKAGAGYYNYQEGAQNPEPRENEQLGQEILARILAMLINEAVDAVFLNIATAEDVDLAMTKGVNYPKGLLQWANELGLPHVLKQLQDLQLEYGEDRYRPSPLLRRMVRQRAVFFK